MLDLNEIRTEIDDVDRQLAALYEKRIALATKVVEYKIETGKKVFDETREKQKLDKVAGSTSSEETVRD